jgi:hypothetical protein
MNSKSDSVEPKIAVEFKCRCCGKVVSICRSCWRNQSYCSAECRILGLKARKSRNQKKYRATKAGVEAHKAAQQRYRLH